MGDRCSKCAENMTASDGRFCSRCGELNPFDDAIGRCQPCPVGYIEGKNKYALKNL